ncbi:MAG: hypothetical protein ACRDTN_01365 [Mycobacterium sp.]
MRSDRGLVGHARRALVISDTKEDYNHRHPALGYLTAGPLRCRV